MKGEERKRKDTTAPKAAQHSTAQHSTAQHSTAHNRILHKRTGKMKTTIVGIAVAAAAVTTVNGLKCEKRERQDRWCHGKRTWQKEMDGSRITR